MIRLTLTLQEQALGWEKRGVDFSVSNGVPIPQTNRALETDSQLSRQSISNSNLNQPLLKFLGHILTVPDLEQMTLLELAQK